MPPTVSVLVTSYNGASFLRSTLDSILSQTYAPAEIILFDDGSTDNTREVVLQMGHRVKYHHSENGGVCRARNIAASLATSQFLAFCDHDDLWRSDKLDQQMELHQQNPNLRYSFTNFSIVVGNVWSKKTKFEDARADFLLPAVPQGSSPLILHDSIYDRLLQFQPIWPSTIVISHQMFNQLGGCREELGRNPSEDLEFTLRCVMNPPIGVVREPVVGVRKHSGNFSGDHYKTLRGQIEILRFALDHHPIGESTRALIEKQIEVRSVDAAYDALRRFEFGEVVSLTSALAPCTLDSKMRLKVLISRLPSPIARQLTNLLIKN